jgi:hypothetical protein
MKTVKILFTFLIVFLSVILYFLFPIVKDLLGYNYDKRIIVKDIQINATSHVEWYHYSYIGSLGPETIEFKKGNKRKIICKSEYVNDIYSRNDSLIIQFSYNNIEVLKDIRYIPEIKIGWAIGGFQKY